MLKLKNGHILETKYDLPTNCSIILDFPLHFWLKGIAFYFWEKRIDIGALGIDLRPDCCLTSTTKVVKAQTRYSFQNEVFFIV